MPQDDIQRTIYKLEIDDSGYIRGVDSMTASTQKLVQVQNDANNTLRTNQQALKGASENVVKTKKDLDDYTGTNERYRKQLEKNFSDAQTDQQRLTDLVKENQLAYEQATKAAQDFGIASEKAANLAANTPTGKIPVPGLAPIPALPGLDQIKSPGYQFFK
jgi:predicted  nucleic acid-binding Zn-ribbon protein